MRKSRSYNDLEKQQILEEIKAVGNISAVAKKNNLPVSTIHTWVKNANPSSSSRKNKEENKQLKDAKSRINDLELENKILKELLKKTYQIWDTD